MHASGSSTIRPVDLPALLARHLGRVADSAVVMIDGEVIHAGPDAGVRRDVMSCSKAATCTVAGLLVGEGRMTPDDEVTRWVDAAPPGATVRHFLTMTSGHNARGGTYPPGAETDGSTTPLDAAPPLFPPGMMWHYHDDALRLFGVALGRVLENETIADFFRRQFADPVGMGGWSWGEFHANGLGTDPASELTLDAHQLARFGDAWRTNAGGLLDPAWIAEATRVQTAHLPPYTGEFYRHLDAGDVFGFLWRSNATGHFPALPRDAFYINGYHHNRLYVVPSWRTTIARTGFDGGLGDDEAGWPRLFEAMATA